MATIAFPEYSGVRCLMMPYIQGELDSVPAAYHSYADIIQSVYLKKGERGFLTIDESPVVAGTPHRGARAKFGRALHTEAGRIPPGLYAWGGGTGWGTPSPPHGWGTPTGPLSWGARYAVTLDRDTRILLANNLDDSCAFWPVEHENTSLDGDIGDYAADYPYDAATFMKAGEVVEIGILTPHESLPVKKDFNRQFLRIIGSGVHGREPYFTENPLVP
jgi:hypothetical protein